MKAGAWAKERNREFPEGRRDAEGSGPHAPVPGIADALPGCGLNHVVQLGAGGLCGCLPPPQLSPGRSAATSAPPRTAKRGS